MRARARERQKEDLEKSQRGFREIDFIYKAKKKKKKKKKGKRAS